MEWNKIREECYLDHIPIITNSMYIPKDLKILLNYNIKFRETNNIIINIDLRVNRRLLKNQVILFGDVDLRSGIYPKIRKTQ